MNVFKLILVFGLLSVAATSSVMAKKPPRDPPPVGDSCASAESFAPDFVFWRDSTSRRVPQVTVFLADAEPYCEIKLVDIPLADTGPINDLKLAFSSIHDAGGFFGRVVWARQTQGWVLHVWKYDFRLVDGAAQAEPGEPRMILDFTTVAEGQRIRQLDQDLSADTQRLVYTYMPYPIDGLAWNIREIAIADCTAAPCAYDSAASIYQLEDDPELAEDLSSPVWGPLGERVYFIERYGDSYRLLARDLASDELFTLLAIENEGLTYGDDGYFTLRQVASGILSDWPGKADGEHLAVEIGWDTLRWGCAYLYDLDVEACLGDLAGAGCGLTREVGGIGPSWTREGKLVHTYQGLTLKNPNNCARGDIALWDGVNLEKLARGWEPKADGG